MNTTQWFVKAKSILDKQELGHLEVHKGKIQLQLKNHSNGQIEIHEFEYIAKDAEHLRVSQ